MADQRAVVNEAASKYGIDPKVLWGVYGTETSFGKDLSTSSAGAVGPFQFEPATAKSLGVNPYDFRSAAFGAARYLSQYKGRGLGGMLSAYNAGPAGGYQADYVAKTLQNARSYGNGPPLKAPPQAKATAQRPAGAPLKIIPGTPGTPGRTVTSSSTVSEPNPHLQGLELLGSLLRSEPGGSENPIIRSGVLAKAEEPTEQTVTHTTRLPGTPGRAPEVQAPNATLGGAAGKLGGFLPGNAQLEVKRVDEGQDIKTNPGGALLAPGDGEVVAVKSDPGGFGPNYPVVKFTSGPLAGTSWYLGHTASALPSGAKFRQGEVLSHTGVHGLGNAAGLPGWAELGLASTLGQGNRGQGAAVRRYLHT